MIKYAFVVFVLFFIVLYIIPSLFYNKGASQMGIWDKIKFSRLLFVYYKRGMLGFRKDDVKSLENFYIDDPFGILFFNKIQKNYPNKVAVVDLYYNKLFFVANPNTMKYVFENSPNIFGPSIYKKIGFGNVMPENIGVTECPYSKIKICKEFKDKRKMNEEIFRTNKEFDYYELMKSSVCKNIKHKIKSSDDMVEISYDIIMDLFFGHKNKKLKQLLVDKFKFVDIDTDFNMYTIYHKLFVDRRPIIEIENYIRNNDMGNSIFGMYKEYEKTNKKKFDLSNEIPHWIGPCAFIIKFYFPILMETILKRKDVYDNLLNEINSGILDIQSKNSYIHYCVVEFFRLYNVIFLQAFRRSLVDIEINGVFYPKNSDIIFNTNTLLRDEKEFPKPNHYIPERWIYKTVEDQHINFGMGPQRCPSINYTPLLFKTMLLNVFSKYKYNLKLQYKTTEVPQWVNGYEISFD